MLLTIGPTGVYLILAVLFLIVLGGGTYVAYRRTRGRSAERTGATRPQRGDGGAEL